jgi:bacteriorhodopsin
MQFLEIISIDPADPVSFTFFTGYMAMLAASVFFFMERSRVADEWKLSMLVSGLITGIAAVHYYYMRDYYQGAVDFYAHLTAGMKAMDEHPISLRYIDWTLTVPLMCVEFYLITKKAGGTSGLLWRLIIASVAMLLLGYIGEAFHADEAESWIWGALSGLAYFYIVWMVWKGEVATLAANAGGKVQSAVKALGWFVLVGWAIYPIGYIAGTAGGLFGVPMFQNLEMDLVYNIGDAINKIGFGLVIYALATKD